MKKKILPIIMILAISTALLAGCTKKGADDKKNKDGYTHISGKEAAKFVENAERMMLKSSMYEARLPGEWVIFRSLFLYGMKTSIRGK